MGETANLGGKDIKKNLMVHIKTAFLIGLNLRLKLDKGKIWFWCGVV